MKEMLQKAEIFFDLPASALDQLTSAAHRRTAQPNDIIFHQGDPSTSFYVVVQGRLRLVQHTADGKDVTMTTFVPGDVIALVVAITREPYPGSGEVLEESELLAIPGSILWSVMNDHAELSMRIVRMIAARLHEAHNRIRELSAERVQQRIARSLLRLAQKVGVKETNGAIRLDIRLSRQDLAQMNGTTLETTSRTLTAWERDGLIDAGREQITILKPHTLVTIAEDLPQ